MRARSDPNQGASWLLHDKCLIGKSILNETDFVGAIRGEVLGSSQNLFQILR
jgi:hypothetical protein